MHLSVPVAYTAVRSKAAALSLLNHCLLLLPLWESIIGLCFAVLNFMSTLVCNHLDGERELVALLGLSCWCLVIVV